jgi:fluoroquinolone resistance protein
MSTSYISDRQFKGESYLEHPLAKGEYEGCTFSACAFSGSDLSGIVFADCVFENCDLSMAKLRGTVFRDVVFKDCKMLGLRFDQCNTFLIAFRFEKCILNFGVFTGLRLKQTIFNECKLEDADFTQADLTKASFNHCDLSRALFDGSDLSQADFRTAYNFGIDPENNTMTRAKFLSSNLEGLLLKHKLDIK